MALLSLLLPACLRFLHYDCEVLSNSLIDTVYKVGYFSAQTICGNDLEIVRHTELQNHFNAVRVSSDGNCVSSGPLEQPR